MSTSNESEITDDPYDLNRFIKAQAVNYDQAFAEIKRGQKTSHWMWYIFPQIAGLGSSYASKLFAVKGRLEAEAYLNHPTLGPRLLECAVAALGVNGRTAYEIFGSIDELKLKSCATLFAAVSPEASVFDELLEKYFQGSRDVKTMELIGLTPEPKDNS